jgi:hypothetical protein
MGSSSADHHWLKSADWDSLANGKLQPLPTSTGGGSR